MDTDPKESPLIESNKDKDKKDDEHKRRETCCIGFYDDLSEEETLSRLSHIAPSV